MMLHLLFALSLLAVVFGLHYDNAFHNIPTIIGETVSERQTTGFSVADGMHMNYEYEQNEQVSISVDSKHKVVDLAKVREINEVMCWQNDTGLAISFESRDAYEMSIKSWSQHSTLVLMAGGLGNCDVDNKHQYHVSSNMHWHEDELVVAVDTEKKDLVDIASKSSRFRPQLE